MENIAQHLLNLLVKISQKQKKDEIISLFLEGVNELIPLIKLEYLSSTDEKAKNCLEISTSSKSHGFISFEGSYFEKHPDLFSSFKSAIQILAINLERVEQNEMLSENKKEFEKLEEEKKQFQIKSQEDLEQFTSFQNKLIDTANVMIVGLDTNGDIQIFNPYAEKLTGYKRAELEGKSWFEVLTPKDKYPEVWKEFSQLMSRELPKLFENPVLTKKGKERIVSWSNNEILNHKNEIIGSISFGIDVTSKRKIESELRENQYLLNEAQKIAKVGNWTLDLSTNEISWSEEMFHIFGLKTEQVAPSIEEQEQLHTPTTFKKLKDCFNLVIKKGKPCEYKGIGIHSSGKFIDIQIKGKGIFNEKGNIIGLHGTVQDITKQKLIEKELIVAKEKAEESDRLKSAFLANLSHEIRTPMNGIMGFTQLLQSPDLTDDKKEDYIQIVQNSGNYLLSIINDIIEIAQIEANQVASKLEETSVNNLLEEIYEEIKISIPKEKKLLLKVEKKLEDFYDSIETDQVKLRQILINLITNAIKYTYSGKINFGCGISGPNEVLFYVKDTGMGIKKEFHTVIFDRFRQVDENNDVMQYGTGLGLSITKSYIELMGGRIWVESELGKGATFYFTLPIDPKKIERKLPNELLELVQLDADKKMTILIVEDDDINFQYLRELLSGPNKKIIHAKDGLEAVDICAEGEPIDLVLMDIRMPRMDGYEALKHIREIRPDLRIIAHTAYSLNTEGTKLMDIGFDGFLAKPLDKSKLFNLLQSLN